MSDRLTTTAHSPFKTFGFSLKLAGALIWCCMLIAYLAFPRLVPYFIEDILESNEIVLRSADFGRPTHSEIVARNVSLGLPGGGSAEFAELRVTYHPLELLGGSLHRLHIAKARVVLSDPSEAKTDSVPGSVGSWPSVREVLNGLPIDELLIASLRVESASMEPVTLTAFLRSVDDSFTHRLAVHSSPWGNLVLEGAAKDGYIVSSMMTLNGQSLGELNLKYPREASAIVEGDLRASFALSSIAGLIPELPYVDAGTLKLSLRGSLLRTPGASLLSSLSLRSDLSGSNLQLNRGPGFLKENVVGGTGTLKNAELRQEISISPRSSPIDAIVNLKHDLSAGGGDAKISCQADAKELVRLLIRAFSVQTGRFETSSGRVSLESSISWGPEAKPWKAEISFDNISLLAEAGELRSASGKLRWAADNADEARGYLQIEEFNPGVPLRSIEATLGLEKLSGGGRLRLYDFQAGVFGGFIRSRNAIVHPLAESRSELRLDIEGMDLAKVARQAGQKKLEMSGTLSGFLPVSLEGGDISIVGGELESPGGSISYRGIPNSGNAALSNALGILEDYQFDLLKVRVDYKPDGSLTLNSRLKGRNPKYQNGRQVNFSLNIEENVKNLLRSLRLSERLEQSIEKNMSKKD